MNKPLLNKVKKFIRENPSKLDMFSVTGDVDCGCIAHHAVRLAGEEFPNGGCGWVDTAASALEITPFQAPRLFHAHLWPRQFRIPFYRARTNKKPTVPITIRRINHFMKTGK